MPSIEIVSLDSEGLFLNGADFKVATLEDNKLQGHRGSFDDYFKDKCGVMIHVGNPYFKKDKEGSFFAGEIINWDFKPNEIVIPNFENGESGAGQSFHFKFLALYQTDIEKLILKAFEKSPNNTVYFMTDYQFGPEAISFSQIDLEGFWYTHSDSGLAWNRLYQIHK